MTGVLRHCPLTPELPVTVLNRTLIAWTQLFGMISFELFLGLVSD